MMRWLLAGLLLGAGCAGVTGPQPLSIKRPWSAGSSFEVIREISWHASPEAFHPEHRITQPVEWESRAVFDGRVLKVEGDTLLVALTLREARIRSLQEGRSQSAAYSREKGLVDLETGRSLGNGTEWGEPRKAMMWSDGRVGAWLTPPGVFGPMIGGADNDLNLITGFLPAPGDDIVAPGASWRGDRWIQIGRYDTVELEMTGENRDSSPAGQGVELAIFLSSAAPPRHGTAGSRVGSGKWRIAPGLTGIEGVARYRIPSKTGTSILEGSDRIHVVGR